MLRVAGAGCAGAFRSRDRRSVVLAHRMARRNSQRLLVFNMFYAPSIRANKLEVGA
jgi:hypothetical protein